MSSAISPRAGSRASGLSDTAIPKRAKANGFARGVRQHLLAGVTPSAAAIVDAAAARGVEVLRSHRRDIDALREAVAVLLADLASGKLR
jgi:hypothetical protein